ncbi:MAG: hypothetical protein WC877_07250 [Dehalococcoidales bacterium]|jgi:hypothetical protein
MTDIVIGAFIAIGGTILGASITGVMAYYNSKQQINANREILNQQFRQKEQEIRIENIIKTREKVLIPLRSALASSLTLEDNELILMVQMMEVKNKGTKMLSESIQRWEEASDKSKMANIELNILRHQISDPVLDQRISEAILVKDRESPHIINLVDLIHKPENWDLDTIKSIKDELEIIRIRKFDKILQVNKRIEELLSVEYTI